MDLPELEEWLRRKTKRESRAHFGLGVAGNIAGALVTLATTGIVTAAVFLSAGFLLEIGRRQWGWQAQLEPSVLSLGSIGAISLIFLCTAGRNGNTDYVFYLPTLNWRANESAGQIIVALWDLFKDGLFAGPRLIRFSLERLRLGSYVWRLDRTKTARVLFLLHCTNKRVPFSDICNRIPGFDEETDLASILLVHGVLHLPSDPPGLSLNSELKKEFGPVPADWEFCFRKIEPDHEKARNKTTEAETHVYDETPPSRAAKPPAFRCTGCRRKFRLRNLQGGVVFQCPLCDTEFRTVADSKGRVRIEVNTEFFDPQADVELSSEMFNAYIVLGLPPEAGLDEAKKAYRRLMKQHHPDSAVGMSPVEQKRMEERSKEINRAYAQIIGKM